MPTLTLNSFVDGDGRSISNWYKINENTAVSGTKTLKNAKIKNIYTNKKFVSLYQSSSYYTFENCEISGIIIGSNGLFVNCEYVDKFMKGCSINLLIKDGAAFSRIAQAYFKNMKIDNSYVKLKGQSASSYLIGYYDSTSDLGKDSYYEIDSPNFHSGSTINAVFSNCVFDITTTSTFTFNINNSSVSPSVINTTKAPNCTAQNKVLGVDSTHWLDTEYLYSIGFNAG